MTGSKRSESATVDAVKTAQEADAARAEKAARDARKASGSAPATDDKPEAAGRQARECAGCGGRKAQGQELGERDLKIGAEFEAFWCARAWHGVPCEHEARILVDMLPDDVSRTIGRYATRRTCQPGAAANG